MVELRKVDYSNIFAILQLDVYSNQHNFVATNSESIAEAYLRQYVMTKEVNKRGISQL